MLETMTEAEFMELARRKWAESDQVKASKTLYELEERSDQVVSDMNRQMLESVLGEVPKDHRKKSAHVSCPLLKTPCSSGRRYWYSSLLCGKFRPLRTTIGEVIDRNVHRLGSSIGHNMFLVYVSPAGVLEAVFTGSTNWTPNGLCAQSNNALLINDQAVAQAYLEYWQQLKADSAQMGDALRQFHETPGVTKRPLGVGGTNLTVWFSPPPCTTGLNRVGCPSQLILGKYSD